jgi:threonine-phosphate decarboxylase
MKPLPDQHGGNIYAAAAALGRRPDRVLDFSANINPLGPSRRAVRAASRACHERPHYPDPECTALRDALADRWRLPAIHFLVGNGSSELIHAIPRAWRIRRMAIVGPTFSEYARAGELAGAQIQMLFADRETGYRPPIEAVTAALRQSPKPDMLVVCNPNSPTGQAMSRADLERTIARAHARGVRVLVDEGFTEYAVTRSVLPLTPRFSNLLILRSFAKFYALPGLRVGYVVGPPDALVRLRRMQPPWAVNRIGQQAAIAALHDRAHERRSVAYMARERARLTAALRAIPGLRVFSSEANFLLVELPAPWTARELSQACLMCNFLIRDCSRVPGLTARTIRIAVLARRDNDRLVRVLAQLLMRSK